MKNRCGSSEQKEHWLYYADDKYDVSTTNYMPHYRHCVWSLMPVSIIYGFSAAEMLCVSLVLKMCVTYAPDSKEYW